MSHNSLRGGGRGKSFKGPLGDLPACPGCARPCLRRRCEKRLPVAAAPESQPAPHGRRVCSVCSDRHASHAFWYQSPMSGREDLQAFKHVKKRPQQPGAPRHRPRLRLRQVSQRPWSQSLGLYWRAAKAVSARYRYDPKRPRCFETPQVLRFLGLVFG